MQLDTHIIWNSRIYIVRGVDPMSVHDGNAELEDAETGERIRVPIDELENDS
jgi:hypothetical protein